MVQTLQKNHCVNVDAHDQTFVFCYLAVNKYFHQVTTRSAAVVSVNHRQWRAYFHIELNLASNYISSSWQKCVGSI